MDVSGWKLMKVDESGLKWIKGDEIVWNCMKVDESGQKWIKVDESGWK